MNESLNMPLEANALETILVEADRFRKQMGLWEKFKYGAAKLSPVFAPLALFGNIMDTYYYLYFSTRRYTETANFFLFLDLFTLPLTIVYTTGLAHRLLDPSDYEKQDEIYKRSRVYRLLKYYKIS